VEVKRPDRQRRRRRGKSDIVEAEAAARAALSGDAAGTLKARDGPVESVRVLRLARRSAIKARTQAANQIRDVIVTAPDQLRSRLWALDTTARVATCARFRGAEVSEPAEATKVALRTLARRHLELSAEIDMLDGQIAHLCAAVNPALLAAQGVGPEVAATLLVSAGDNPHRMGSQAAFAALCGASPGGGLLRQGHPPPAQQRRRPPGEQRPVADRARAHVLRPAHPGLVARRTLEGKSKKGDRPLPQAPRRPGDLPTPDQPASRATRRRAAIRTRRRRHHARNHRPSPRALAHLRTRTRPDPRRRARRRYDLWLRDELAA
jgi:transposase